MYFTTPIDAVGWAEEVATRPHCDTQFAKLLARPGRGGGLTPMEVRDLAMTITSAVAAYDPPKGVLFQCVYGVLSVPKSAAVAELVAEEAISRGLTGKKPRDRVQRLAEAVIEHYRREHHALIRLSRAKMAQIVGVSRQTFSTGGWPQLEADVRGIIQGWLAIAERGITQRLKEKGVLG